MTRLGHSQCTPTIQRYEPHGLCCSLLFINIRQAIRHEETCQKKPTQFNPNPATLNLPPDLERPAPESGVRCQHRWHSVSSKVCRSVADSDQQARCIAAKSTWMKRNGLHACCRVPAACAHSCTQRLNNRCDTLTPARGGGGCKQVRQLLALKACTWSIAGPLCKLRHEQQLPYRAGDITGPCETTAKRSAHTASATGSDCSTSKFLSMGTLIQLGSTKPSTQLWNGDTQLYLYGILSNMLAPPSQLVICPLHLKSGWCQDRTSL